MGLPADVLPIRRKWFVAVELCLLLDDPRCATPNALHHMFKWTLLGGAHSNRKVGMDVDRQALPGVDVGDPERIAVVQRIYRWHFQDRWGYTRIARALNDAGIPSALGMRWHVEAVRQILLNPIYTGLGISNRTSTAIYHERAPDAPRPVTVDPVTLAKYARPPVRTRPRQDWVECDHDVLRDFIHSDIRALAQERHAQRLDAQAAGRTPKPDRDRHRDSEFILKGVLVSKQGGHPLTGRRTGTKPHRKRYYGVSRSRSLTTSDPVLRKLIPAEPIEQAVLGILRMLLLRKADLERDVRTVVERVIRREATPGQQIDDLARERDAVSRKLNFALDTLDELGKDAAKETIERLQARLRALDVEVNRRSRIHAVPVDAEATVRQVMGTLNELGDHMDDLPRAALRRFVVVFVSRALANLETRHVELELRLPEWVLTMENPMCLDTTIPWKPGNEAHADSGILMLAPSLIWDQESYSYIAVDFARAA